MSPSSLIECCKGTTATLILMVFIGAARTIITKLYYQVGFDDPYFVTMMYVFGQSFAFPLYFYLKKHRKIELKDEEQEITFYNVTTTPTTTTGTNTPSSSSSSCQPDVEGSSSSPVRRRASSGLKEHNEKGLLVGAGTPMTERGDSSSTTCTTTDLEQDIGFTTTTTPSSLSPVVQLPSTQKQLLFTRESSMEEDADFTVTKSPIASPLLRSRRRLSSGSPQKKSPRSGKKSPFSSIGSRFNGRRLDWTGLMKTLPPKAPFEDDEEHEHEHENEHDKEPSSSLSLDKKEEEVMSSPTWKHHSKTIMTSPVTWNHTHHTKVKTVMPSLGSPTWNHKSIKHYAPTVATLPLPPPPPPPLMDDDDDVDNDKTKVATLPPPPPPPPPLLMDDTDEEEEVEEIEMEDLKPAAIRTPPPPPQPKAVVDTTLLDLDTSFCVEVLNVDDDDDTNYDIENQVTTTTTTTKYNNNKKKNLNQNDSISVTRTVDTEFDLEDSSEEDDNVVHTTTTASKGRSSNGNILSHSSPLSSEDMINPATTAHSSNNMKVDDEDEIILNNDNDWIEQLPLYVKVLPGSILQLLGTIFLSLSTLYLAAAVGVMLMNGLEIIMSILARRFLRHKYVSRNKWLGVIILTIGIFLIGISEVLVSDAAPASENFTLGLFCVLLKATSRVGADFTEEYFMKDTHVPPLLMLGTSSLYGTIMFLPLYLTIGPILGYIPMTSISNVFGSFGSVMFTFLLLSIIFLYGVYNIMVIYKTNVLTKNMLKGFRGLVVWIFGLLIFYTLQNEDLGEAWIRPSSHFMMSGFSIMMVGLIVYSQE